VSHPGNFMDDRSSGIARNADAIVQVLDSASNPTILLIETTAGSGTAIASTFEEMAELIERVPEPHRSRIGVCIDTAHVFAAGYNLITDYDGVIARANRRGRDW